ncbi:LacI family DNA-binding transcriptional regulator [Thalassococcus sp. BH17M4-6]|uniref:LacI family DNA-binding transcriptional regulator n=1 Tax=Thalassococcus sp. BH17M4-6 TaxID=3413148 RepID=UPI003BDAEFA8
MNLKELAQHLNLSQTTVSRALNGYPEVRDATRKRVQEAAIAFNYTPNTRAKALATGRSMSIGTVIPTSNKHEMVNPIFGDFVTGASEAYVKAGYDMVLTLIEDGEEERLYRAIRAKGNVDGIMLHSPTMDDPRVGLLKELGLPFVVHGRASHLPPDYSWLDMNNKRAFQRATAFLLELGHRRIALINGLEQQDFAFRRRSGYVEALAQHGLTEDPALMTSSEMTELEGYRAAHRMLALPDPPTAFLCSSMLMAIGTRRAVADARLDLGRDVSVITHDDDLSYLKNGQDVPIFTATRSSMRDAGRRAATMLLQQIAEPGGQPMQYMMEAELIVGQSTGPAPRR